jgi:actin-like ATPase involved in cell morphogenesis
MSEQVPSVGIDFGTTNSCMAWYDPRSGTAEVILNAEGQTKTPSLVSFGEDETLVGEVVENMLQDAPTDAARRNEVFGRTVGSIKRNLLSPPRIALPGGRYVRPVEVAAEVLKKLKRDAEEGHFHEEVGRAIITCPAEFTVLQRQKIEEAGKLAGFGEVVLLEEPVAGALAYARAGLNVGGHILVYDLGGGTFDLAVLDNEDESFHVAMEPRGMERCGGDDFDLALYHHCDEVARENLGRPISLTGAVDPGFLRACRRRKESLTFRERDRFSNYLPSDNGPVLFEHEVDRATFEGLIEGYVETTARLTEEIVIQAEASGHEVDTVVLVGGSSRVRLVGRMLQEILPVAPLGFDKRDVAVALGAAHYANVRWPPQRRSKMPESAATRRMETTHLDRYRAAVEEMSAGGRLKKVEVDRLNAFARQLGLNREQTARAERAVMGNSKEGILFQQYRRAVETVWSDGKVNTLEARWLDALAGQLGLTPAQTSYAETGVMGDPKEKVLDRGPASLSSTEAFELVHTLTGHSGEVHSVAFGPDGRSLVSGASDHRIVGWNARTGGSAGTLSGHAGRVNSVSFGPDGSLLTSGGFDGTVRVWKLPNGEPSHTLNHPDWVFAVAFGPDGATLASGAADGEVRLWSLESGEQLRAFTGHSHWVMSVAFSPDGRLLLSGGADKTLRVWDANAGTPLHIFERPDWVRSVAFGADGRLGFGGCEDGSIGVWDVRSGEPARAFAGHSGAVLCVAASPDGRLLYSGGADGKVKVWDASTGEPLHVLLGHAGGVGAVAAGPGGLLASGGGDGAVRVWEKVLARKGQDGL